MDTLVKHSYHGNVWIYLMTKLYTFGCSFTKYHWPTWADILGRSYDYYENWGQGGAGNLFIYNSVVECILKKKLTSNDQVIIMWSSAAREDRYINNKWITQGGLYVENQAPDVKGYLIRDLSLIYGTEQILKQNNIPYKFLSMIPLNFSSEFEKTVINHVDDVLTLYHSTISAIEPSIYEVVFKYDWFSRPKKEFSKEQISQIKKLMSTRKKLQTLLEKYNYVDPHPLPIDYLEYLDKVLPNSIDDTTREWVNSITRDVLNNKNINWSHPPIERI